MVRSSRTALSVAAVAIGLLGLTAPAFTSFALNKSSGRSNAQRSLGRTQRQAEVNQALQPPALIYSQAADGSMLEASGPIVTYSQVLFDAAKAKKETVFVTTDVLAMKVKLQDDEFLEKWVLITNNFNIEKKDRSSVLVDLLGPFKSTVVPKFIVFLTKKQRAMSLRRIVKHYVTSLYQQMAIEPVTVKSAQRLTSEQQEAIKQKMKAKLGAKDIKLVTEVDANLLAGFILEWGYVDKETLRSPANAIDLTMKNHLAKSANKQGVMMQT
ncbi:unnamed protein product [Polarella glacialis]|uniref:Uncharacterized protein n=1 Tax=Polarella glacialis TaxID=89957 RepID=A0A813L6N1_POLGL|nr:unnamed protein product [Polarella glacialis]